MTLTLLMILMRHPNKYKYIEMSKKPCSMPDMELL